MTTNHIDTLAQWWETAKEGVINEGDRLIYRDGNDYDFRTATREDDGTGAEKEHEHGWGILARAPKPKPAWHDAVAVIAHKVGEYGVTAREVYVSGVDDKWVSACYYAHTSELIDPVPLIEAKVTDEMVLRALNASTGLDLPHHTSYKRDEVEDMRFALNAALNIDPSA